MKLHAELWPPLSLIRTALGLGEGDGNAAAVDTCPPVARPTSDGDRERTADSLMEPLLERARRREAVARRAFPARWAPGRLVGVVHEGRLFGVLLDECVGDGRWRGWLAAGETEWAGAHDVLLEPGDEPFEPMFGLIQAWNPLTLQQTPQLCARVLGELSATRLAAIRAVHEEWQTGGWPAIDPAPGRVAVRTAGGVFSVRSGTPLAARDPRAAYQHLYLDVAARLQASTVPRTVVADPRVLPLDGGWSRMRRWFAADAIVRPALAVLALVLVVENMALLSGPSKSDIADEVQVRSVPDAPAATSAAATAASPELTLRWRPGVEVQAAQALLRAAGADMIGGPDANGGWRLRLKDVVEGRIALAASPLVESMEPP